jgi:hypothetical protein
VSNGVPIHTHLADRPKNSIVKCQRPWERLPSKGGGGCVMSNKLLVAVVLSMIGTPAFAQSSGPTSLTPKQCDIGGDERIIPNILGFDPKDAQKIIEDCGFLYDGATDVHTLSY